MPAFLYAGSRPPLHEDRRTLIFFDLGNFVENSYFQGLYRFFSSTTSRFGDRSETEDDVTRLGGRLKGINMGPVRVFSGILSHLLKASRPMNTDTVKNVKNTFTLVINYRQFLYMAWKHLRNTLHLYEMAQMEKEQFDFEKKYGWTCFLGRSRLCWNCEMWVPQTRVIVNLPKYVALAPAANHEAHVCPVCLAQQIPLPFSLSLGKDPASILYPASFVPNVSKP